MNAAHWHLVVNHLPIIFPIAGIIIMITGLISRSEAIKRTAFLIFMISALAAITAMRTGDDAEDEVKKISEVSESYIETHEDAAETFAVLLYFLGVVSVLGLWVSFTQKKFSSILNIITLLFAFVVLFFGKETGTTGGEIRHAEIRNENGFPTLENQHIEKDIDD